MAEKTYQMLWDCAYCGTTGLLALDHKHCPECGGAQDPKWRYFPSAEQKVAVEDHVYTGKDLICPACETPNAGGAKFCSNCGSDLDSAKEVQTRAEQSAAEGTSTFSEDDAKKARDEHKAVRKAEREKKVGRTIGAPSGDSGGSSGGSSGQGGLKAHLPKIGIAALVVFVVACLGCVGVFALWKKDAKLQSTGHSWERTIAVEQMKEVRESAWQDEVPRGASNLRCKTEKRSTKKVKDGQTCTTKRKDNGDGTYSEREVCNDKYRTEPVYDEKCSYDIDKWVKVRTEKASGSSVTDTPKWPAVHLKRKGSCMGCEREGKRHESYTLHFKADGEKKSCTVPEKTWSRVKVGSKWTGKVGVLSGSLDCSELKPAK